jgi:predicted ATPase
MMPSGVVTFLFTDIEGSTRRWESDADTMREALAAHDEVLRQAIEAHDGFVFKHTGDGMCAAFASPRAAVDAAIDAQRALELPVRMGIATGEADLRDGDYFGAVLNRVARLMAAGHGGQVLVAESTAGLVSGVDLVSLGIRRLRDVANPMTIYQLRAPGLRPDFAPLRTLDQQQGNLRQASSMCIGRETDIADITAALAAHRLITLTGVGGVGKTRLALEVAAQLIDEFPDGAWFFELGAVTDAAAVPDAVAAVLGITQQPGSSMTESIAAALDGKVALLLLDDCEHLLDAAADLAEAILASSSTIRILATSREGLALEHEQIWPVRSLDVAAAAQLFIDRAGQVAPGAVLDDADVVAEICRRLDSIPLAIELAASRMSSMAAAEIRNHLDHRFRLLVGSRRSLGRHQTLRHAVSWSYDLLDDAERLVLQRCSVFAGGFDLDGACAVAETDRFQTLDLLDALVRKSLIVARESAGHTRYSMLETIREFADEQLVARGDAAHVRDLHAHFFAHVESAVMALWNSPRQREAYTWFTTELANLRSAFRWAADQGRLDTAAAIATYSGVLSLALENQEPSLWAEELVPAARAADHPRLAYLYVISALCWMGGRIDDALAYTDSAMAVVRARGDDVPFGFAGMLGGTYMFVGDFDSALDWQSRYLEPSADPLAITRSNRVLQLVMAGRQDEAMAAAPAVVDAAQAGGNPSALCDALLAFGYAFREADPRRALDAMGRGLAIAHESGVRSVEGYLALNIGLVEWRCGHSAAALDHLAQAIRVNRDSGSTSAIRFPLGILGAVFEGLGRHRAAATVAGFALHPMTVAAFPDLTAIAKRLNHALGDDAYTSNFRRGEAMTAAEIAAFAYEQIEQARADLR